MPLHRVNLHRRGLRAKRKIARNIEGVCGVASRMTRRNIERVEVIEAGLDLRPVLDRVAHRNKDIFKPVANKGQWMEMTARRTGPGERNVDPVAFERPSLGICSEALAEPRDLGFDKRA